MDHKPSLTVACNPINEDTIRMAEENHCFDVSIDKGTIRMTWIPLRKRILDQRMFVSSDPT